MPMQRPQRRPPDARQPAPRPRGFLGRPVEGGRRRWLRGLVALNRALYRSRLGPGLRRRLAEGLELPEIPIRLARGGADLHGLRIALVSDLHAGGFHTERELAQIFEAVTRARPDLVGLGGDLVEGDTEDCRVLGKALSLLRAPLGVFAVPGNHDHGADPTLRIWRACLEEHGVTVLSNAGRRVARGGASLFVSGVDDLSHGRPDLVAALRGAREDEPVLLLAHHPDFFVEAASLGVDLTLSGHTHGGQITWFGRTPLRHTSRGFWRGRFEYAGAQLYVGRGAGTTGLPLRVCEPAEVPVIRLETR